MSLAASAPHHAAQAGGMSSPAHRAKPAHPLAGGAGPVGSAGLDSPFAQWLQGTANDEPEDEGSGADEQRTSLHGKEEHAAPADTSGRAQLAPDALPPDLALSLRQAILLAAARVKADAAAHNRRAAIANLGVGLDASQADRAQDPAHGLSGPDPSAPGAGAVDISGFQRVLDATPVNLAAAESAPMPAAADFSLPSLGAQSGAAAAPAPEAAPAQATLAPPPGSAAFPAALGAQLNTWLKDGVQYATLELNPQDMGPIDVRIALQDGRTQVELGVGVAETRAALAEALPALAEALGDVGLSLAGGSVSDQTGQQARQGDPQGQRAFALPGWAAPGRDDGDSGAAARPAARLAQRGLVDLVA